MAYWLMKTEPSVFSIDDLEKRRTEPWDGVRNYQVRNYLRDTMQIGDLALFYHSSCPEPGVAGVCRIASAAEADPTQWIAGHDHFDSTSPQDNPRWWLRKVEFVERFATLVSLETLRAEPTLQQMLILRRGNRLSITPVTKTEFDRVVRMGRKS